METESLGQGQPYHERHPHLPPQNGRVWQHALNLTTTGSTGWTAFCWPPAPKAAHELSVPAGGCVAPAPLSAPSKAFHTSPDALAPESLSTANQLSCMPHKIQWKALPAVLTAAAGSWSNPPMRSTSCAAAPAALDLDAAPAGTGAGAFRPSDADTCRRSAHIPAFHIVCSSQCSY
jgi:hypothetical protein